MAGLRVERPAEGVALVVLDRPERANAFDDELLTHVLYDTFTGLDEDDEVGAIVITGEGTAFSAGADFSSSGFDQPSALEAEGFVRGTHRTPVAVRNLSKPSIAAVNGAAAGAGLGLALACDLRYASRSARFSSPFAQMGLVPDYGVSYFLPRVVGTATALDILLTGRTVDAEEALAIGLVSQVVDDVMEVAIDAASRIAAQPSRAVNLTRANVYRAMELSLEAEVLEQETRTQALALKGPEFAERFESWRDLIQKRRRAE